MTMTTFTVERRFNGPPDSANGGYFAGLVSLLAHRTMTVRLLKPPPLDTALTWRQTAESSVEVRHGDELVAQAKPGTVSLEAPPAPPQIAVVEASTRYAGFEKHPFNTCFVCGPKRARGDGLRIFPGRLAQTTLTAAPWVPDETLDRGDGKVRPEYMWAALDCPGWHAVLPDARLALLGEITAHVDRAVRVGETCSILGWSLASTGRKHQAGTAIYDGSNVLCARARAVWIEPK